MSVTGTAAQTLANRKAAAARLLGWQPQRSDRWIAQATGLAPGTVASLRRRGGITAWPGAARIGRDGRIRPVDPAEGRLRVHQEIRSRPDASLRQIARAAGVSPATVRKVRDQLRRAADPVPDAQHAVGAGACAAAGARIIQAEHPGRRNGVPTGPAAIVLRELSKDPSLRYTDSGRALLRLLDLQARGASRIEALIEQAPPHCGYLLTEIARACAAQWQALAVTLERRLIGRPPRPL